MFWVGFLCMQYAPETILPQVTVPDLLTSKGLYDGYGIKHIHSYTWREKYDRMVTFFQC